MSVTQEIIYFFYGLIVIFGTAVNISHMHKELELHGRVNLSNCVIFVYFVIAIFSTNDPGIPVFTILSAIQYHSFIPDERLIDMHFRVLLFLFFIGLFGIPLPIEI